MIELGLCQCGCGQKTKISNVNDITRGYEKGKPRRYLTGHWIRNKRGDEALRWNGGKSILNGKYQMILAKHHPKAKGTIKYVLEHVLIAEKVLGRHLISPEEIHHINRKGLDNKNENLVICQDRAYHMLLHRRVRAFKESGHANWLKCCRCLKYDDPINLKITPAHPFHIECERKHDRERYRRKAI